MGQRGYAVKWSAVTTTGVAASCSFRIYIEAKDAARFINRHGVFQCYIRHDIGSAVVFTVGILKANAADNFSATTSIATSAGTSVPSATNTAVTSGEVAMSTCGNGIYIDISGATGAITNKNIWLTDAQFELGSTPTTYECRSMADETDLCAWYCEKFGQVAGMAIGMGQAYGAANAYGFASFSPKRVAPTITISGATAFNLAGAGGGTIAAATLTAASVTTKAWEWLATVASGLVTGNATSLVTNGTTTGYALIDADF